MVWVGFSSDRYDDMDVYQYELPEQFDDEEVDEDTAFNDDDNVKYGELLHRGGKNMGAKKRKKLDENSDGENEDSPDDFEDDDNAYGDLMDLSDMLMPRKRTDDSDILGNRKHKKKKNDEVHSDSDEGGDEEENERNHQSLLAAIDALGATKKRGKARDEMTEHHGESEYNITALRSGEACYCAFIFCDKYSLIFISCVCEVFNRTFFSP